VSKVLLLSVIGGIMIIPLLAARMSNPRRALGRVILYTFLFNLVYLLAVRFIYPRLQ
jgi:hypothetical protein